MLLGKLNMTEFATTALSHQFDPPRNPWNTERSCGGSSSGSGGATAAFMAAATLGEDTGGSVRCPAAWCGLAGLRPTWGLVSRYGVAPGVRSMDTVGPLTRSVEDCAIVLQAIAGHDPSDRLTRQDTPPDYRAALTGDISGLRFGILREVLYAESVEPDVGKAILDAANAQGKMGASVEEISVSDSGQRGSHQRRHPGRGANDLPRPAARPPEGHRARQPHRVPGQRDNARDHVLQGNPAANAAQGADTGGP